MDSLDSQQVGFVFILRILNSPFLLQPCLLHLYFRTGPQQAAPGQHSLFSLPGEGTHGSLEGSFGYLIKLYVILGSGVEM